MASLLDGYKVPLWDVVALFAGAVNGAMVAIAPNIHSHTPKQGQPGGNAHRQAKKN